MKKILIALSLLAASTSFAEKKEYGEVEVDWNAKYLEESLVLMCDDTYLSGVDLLIPGDLRSSDGVFVTDVYTRFEDCDTGWSISNRKVITKDGQPYTKIRFESSGGACTIKVKEKGAYPKTPKVFTLDISDAC